MGGAETVITRHVCSPGVPERVLLRVAFDGARFHGTQRQPDVPTVSQAFLDALDDADVLAPDPALRAQGRVDSGVSARDHALALTVATDLEQAAGVVAGATRGIVPWAGARVWPGYDPRFSTLSRTYRYHLPADPRLDPARLEEAWRLFEGTHDVRRFARLDPDVRDQDPIRCITRTHAWTTDEHHVLEVTGRTFLRHQVRRMVAAAEAAARGELALDRIRSALTGAPLDNHGKAPAQGLILHRIALPADWQPLAKAEAIARRRLAATRRRLVQRLALLDEVRRPSRRP